MTILSVSFMQVRKLFLKYQEEKYKEIKTALWLYYCFDMVVYAIIITLIGLRLFGDNSAYLLYIIKAERFLFPFFQALGVCIFKSSMDPLSNISAMDHLKLVSDNQVPTDSYWGSMVKDINLDEEERD